MSEIKKHKFSWGTGILIGIIVFVVISVSMTIIFMMQDVNLVNDKYYENSLQYQDEIDKQNRTLALSEDVIFNFNGELISISFPENYLNKKISGEIEFYRPSDPKLDFKLPLQLVEGNQIVPVSRIEKGFWRVKLNWVMDGNGYYNERAITIE